ncbi:MAG TPA: dTDP-4-dehydrorhamnose 3,5-epimerase family protein [Aquihabitans sp.]|nr:dTDP-4-dehydrorhamnose 3,5-epimerase family protein [Aquihabitans sp.]
MEQLDGVRQVALVPHEDERGSFTEVFATHWDTGVEPTQWSLVRSEARALRGMHIHARHGEYLSVLSGVLWVGLHDLRPTSPTRGMGQLIRLSGDEPSGLSIPSGIVHGWIAEVAAAHLQAVSESFATYGADDNEGCRWDDPDLGFTWPLAPTLVSARSEAFGSLSDLRAAREGPGVPAATAGTDAAAR